jgi:Diguanylate cyclase, GGDEF domain
MNLLLNGEGSRVQGRGGPVCPGSPASAPTGRAHGVDAVCGAARRSRSIWSTDWHAAGAACAWAAVHLPAVAYPHEVAWLLLGSPRRLPSDVITSIEGLVNQVSLALRNSQTHQQLRVQATLDGLTGLANRGTFNATLSEALAEGGAADTTVLFVDLDDFKDVNDAFGHGAGDDLLREIATRLASHRHRRADPSDPRHRCCCPLARLRRRRCLAHLPPGRSVGRTRERLGAAA